MHRWLSTDSGSQCFRCGLVLDYEGDDHNAAAIYAPACPGPVLERAHHLVYYGDRLECAYGDATILDETEFASISLECSGD